MPFHPVAFLRSIAIHFFKPWPGVGSAPLKPLPLVTVFLVALSCNWAFFSYRGFFLLPDSNYRYLPIAEYLFDVWVGSVFDTPGYPVFIWAVFAVFGKGAGLPLVQGVLSAMTSVLTVRIGNHLGLDRLALVAGFLVALNPATVLFANTALSETFFAFVMALATWSVVRLPQTPAWQSLLWPGFAAGLTAITRANGVLIILMLCLCIAFRPGLKRGWWRVLVFLAVGALPVGSWVAVNWRIQHVAAICHGSGWQFMQNLAYLDLLDPAFLPEDVRHLYSDMRSLGKIREFHMYEKRSQLARWQIDAVYKKAAVESVRAHPGDYLAALWPASRFPRKEVRDLAKSAVMPGRWAYFGDAAADAGYGQWYRPVDTDDAFQRLYEPALKLISPKKYRLGLVLTAIWFFVAIYRSDAKALAMAAIPFANGTALFLMLNTIDRYYFSFEPFFYLAALALYAYLRKPQPQKIPIPIAEAPELEMDPVTGRKLIIVPAYNEAENLAKVVARCRQLPGWALLVVNDGSVDRTAEVIAEMGVPAIHLPVNLGIGAAMQTGYRYAQKHGFEVAVQIDGDGQHDPIQIPKLMARMADADCVVGSRYLQGTGFQSTLLRRLGIRLIALVFYLSTGRRIRDCTSGMRCVNRRLIGLFAEYYPPDYPEPESLSMLLRAGFRVAEVAVTMKAREGGRSSIVGWSPLFYMSKILPRIILSSLFRRYS